jgi:methyl-accepting chemotaxis protein
MFKKISFKHKIIFGFLIPILTLVGSSIFLGIKMTSVQETSLDIKNTEIILASAANEMKFDAAEVQQWLTDVSATRGAPGFDDGPKKAEEYATILKKQLDIFQSHYERTKNTEKLSQIKLIREKFDAFYQTGITMSKLYIKDGPTAGNAYMEHFDKAAEELDKLFTPFVQEHIKRMNASIDTNDKNISKSISILKITLFLSAIMSVCVFAILITSINTINFQFKEIGNFALKLKEGDLKARVNINSRDEVGRLASAFNETALFISDAFKSDQINWDDVSAQKEREIEAQKKIAEALKDAEREKVEAMQAKQMADLEKSKAEEAMVMASDEKKRAEELAVNEKRNAEELRSKVDKILSVVKAAENGDLTCSINLDGPDTIGQLSHALDSFFEQLSSDLIRIDDYAKNLDKQSLDLSAKSNIVGSNSKETTDLSSVMLDQANKVIANINNLNHSTAEIKLAVSEISKQAVETSRFSTSAVKLVNDAKDAGSKLQESSNDIAQFINVISAIARQTNLLALNATIEAARAGEAGRGFAVVANEVKELARQSAQAAEEITNKVMTIKNNSTNLSSSITEINVLMENINHASRVVASATEQQFATTDQFVELIGFSVKEADLIGSGSLKVNTSAKNVSEVIKENILISSDLSNTSHGLNSVVKKFKLKSHTNKSRMAA